MLTISEQLMMVSYDADGKLITHDRIIAFPYAVTGAVLAELLLDGALSLNEHHRVATAAAAPRQEAGRHAVARIGAMAPSRDLAWWVPRLNARSELRRLLLRQLVERGCLREERHRILGVFPTRRYPCGDLEVRRTVEERLREASLSRQEPDIRTRALIAMVRLAELAGVLVAAPAELRPARITADRVSAAPAHDEMIDACVDAVATAIAAARERLRADLGD